MDPLVISYLEKSNEYNDMPSFGHLLMENLSKAENNVILVSGITSEELTAKNLLERSILVSKALIAAGVKPGDVISIVSENRFEFAYILFGTLLLNCKFAPINLTYSEREMTHAFNLSKPKVIFLSPYASEKVINVAKSLSFVKKKVLIDEENDFTDDVVLFKDFIKQTERSHFTPMAVDKSKTVALILCSSGTTGLPKGVQISQQNLIVVARFCKNTVMRLGDIEGERVILGLIPWFHAFGLTTLAGIVASRSGRIVLLPKFEEGLFLSCLETYQCNVVFMVPPLMVFLAKHPMVDGYDLSSIRIMVCGAAPLSKELEQAVYDRLQNKKLHIRQGYGMSEMSLAVLLQKTICKPGSVGEIIEGSEVKIIDESGKSLGPNERGELCFRGNQIMMGYIGDDKATKSTIDANGWLHTGDIGYYDEDKQFFIVDRIKELIKWKGYQVPPAEIEAVLLTNRKIKDAAVIGIPDSNVGELPLAFVVKADESLTEEEVMQFVAKTVSPAKRLHGGVKFINEIPKNPSGKILRRELRDLVKQSNVKSKL
ncbi:CLUMA_CG017249, isoform A [Clunio marinus]|uniref:Luciferin 4-monooxygenase n=1 Tax=Clunio marinus TaxID=568069 RepID=A0A1J1IWR9_9DIPT|nr:CLUMA_CG017249, isoform A [Clunio marinus]